MSQEKWNGVNQSGSVFLVVCRWDAESVDGRQHIWGLPGSMLTVWTVGQPAVYFDMLSKAFNSTFVIAKKVLFSALPVLMLRFFHLSAGWLKHGKYVLEEVSKRMGHVPRKEKPITFWLMVGLEEGRCFLDMTEAGAQQSATAANANTSLWVAVNT